MTKARSFAWQNGVLDELNAELQLREDLKNGGLKSKLLFSRCQRSRSTSICQTRL